MKKELGVFLVMVFVSFLIWLVSVSFVLPVIKTNANEVPIQKKLFFWVFYEETGQEKDKETIVAGEISGVIKVSDWRKFAERFVTMQSFTERLAEYIESRIGDTAAMYLADGPRRYEFAKKIIKEENLTTTEAVEKRIKARYPWIWLYGPSNYETWKQQPEILEFAINTGNKEAWSLYVAIQYEKFMESFPNEILSIESQEKEFLQFWRQDLVAKAEKLLSEFEIYLKQRERTLVFHNNAESLLLDIDLFMGTPDPAFRKLATIRWQKAKLLDRKESLRIAMDMLVLPHFASMEGERLNNYFWHRVINAALDPANAQIERGWDIDWKKISYLLIPSNDFLAEIMKSIPEGSFDGVWKMKSLTIEVKEFPLNEDKDFQPYYQYWLDKNR